MLRSYLSFLVLSAIFITKAESQNRFDIIITEIMADPSPVVSLPNNEWIEIKNTSGVFLNLQNWRIADLSTQSGPLPNYILPADSFLIICGSGSLPAMSQYGRAVSVTGFPSLDNDGDLLSLKAPNGKAIHAVQYSTGWYKNELKKEGGWALEMIDPSNPCSGNHNWKASIHPSGGSPGKLNSVFAANGDNEDPVLKNAFLADSLTVMIVFDEPLDSLNATVINHYLFSHGIAIQSVSCISPLFNIVQLKLTAPLQRNITYSIKVNGLTDCKGNGINNNQSCRVGISEEAIAGDAVINEIMFNPRPGGYDYIELFNPGKKIIDASQLFISNRSSTGVINTPKPLSPAPFYIFPNDFVVLTEDPNILALHYFIKEPAKVLMISTMPSFPDDSGTVLLLNAQGNIIDEVPYNENWHFKLIQNNEGVALERIAALGLSADKNNWHSAASTEGYGTPTAKNSQYLPGTVLPDAVTAQPTIISPDNDGRNDFCTIQYEMDQPGNIASIMIYDIRGRIVRKLASNVLMGIKGNWQWDGLGDASAILSTGPYIIFVEIFNLAAQKQNFKIPVVLAGKLK